MQNKGGDRISLLQETTSNAMQISTHYCFYGACAGGLLALAIGRPRSSFSLIGLGMGIGSGFVFKKSNEFIVFKRNGGSMI